MFLNMYNQWIVFLSNSYLLPFWIMSGAVVIAGACAVVLKGLFIVKE